MSTPLAGPKLQILKSVPSGIATQVRFKGFRQALSPTDLAAIDRLVTREQMKPVWETLTAPGVDENMPHDFFGDVVHGLEQWREVSKTRKGEAWERLNRLAAKAEELANSIDASTPEILLMQSGPILVDEALMINAFDLQKDPGYSPDLIKDRVGADGIKIQSVLRALAAHLRTKQTSYYARHRPPNAESPDPDSTSADQTYWSVALSDLFERHLGAPKPHLVTRTVETILDLDPNSNFGDSHVRKAYQRQKRRNASR